MGLKTNDSEKCSISASMCINIKLTAILVGSVKLLSCTTMTELQTWFPPPLPAYQLVLAESTTHHLFFSYFFLVKKKKVSVAQPTI